MKTIQVKGGIPILSYLDDLEEGALQQAENCARLPFAFHHIALMPDAHQGYAMPIGGVMACKDHVVPYAVGVDIGCGMFALRTSLTRYDVANRLQDIVNEGLRTIPVSFEWHKKPQDGKVFRELNVKKGKKKLILEDDMPVVAEHLNDAKKQLGTLGGGNHFIEIQGDDQDHVWVMVHSGSRNIGLKVANYYHQRAKDYVKANNINVGKEYAYLPADHDDGVRYFREMDFCVRFAFESREKMRTAILDVLRDVVRDDFAILEEVQTAHNYASWEDHFGEHVLVHRKGAVRAREGEMVTIPGSMGTASYIGRGKGNPDSFESCSHGAGRSKGRKQAMREIPREQLEKEMGSVILGCAKIKDAIQEAPSAYKDIDEVMMNQVDLVDVAYRLTPLAVMKG